MFGAPFSPKRAACGAQRRPRRCGWQIRRFCFSRSPSSPCAADPSAASAAIVTDLRCRRGKFHDSSFKKRFDGFAGNFWYFGFFRRLLLFFVLWQRLALSVIAARCQRPGCGTQRLLRCRLHPAGRCPNSSSLFPPLAAVVAVAPKGEPLASRATFRWTHKAQQGAKERASLTGAAASGQEHLVKLL